MLGGWSDGGGHRAPNQVDHRQQRARDGHHCDECQDVARRHGNRAGTQQLDVSAAHPAPAPADGREDKDEDTCQQAHQQVLVETACRDTRDREGKGQAVRNGPGSHVMQGGREKKRDADGGQD